MKNLFVYILFVGIFGGCASEMGYLSSSRGELELQEDLEIEEKSIEEEDEVLVQKIDNIFDKRIIEEDSNITLENFSKEATPLNEALKENNNSEKLSNYLK